MTRHADRTRELVGLDCLYFLSDRERAQASAAITRAFGEVEREARSRCVEQALGVERAFRLFAKSMTQDFDIERMVHRAEGAFEVALRMRQVLVAMPEHPELAKLRAVAAAARMLTSAADACDREAERHPSSRSSAPMVRYVGAMEKLRAALDALDGDKT